MRPPPFIRYSLNAAIKQFESYYEGVKKNWACTDEWRSTQYGYEIRKTKSGLEYRRVDGWENWSDPMPNFFAKDTFPEEESDLF